MQRTFVAFSFNATSTVPRKYHVSPSALVIMVLSRSVKHASYVNTAILINCRIESRMMTEGRKKRIKVQYCMIEEKAKRESVE